MHEAVAGKAAELPLEELRNLGLVDTHGSRRGSLSGATLLKRLADRLDGLRLGEHFVGIGQATLGVDVTASPIDHGFLRRSLVGNHNAVDVVLLDMLSLA